MTDKIVVLSTCPTQEEAQKLASMLIDKRLAACVQILPGVESVYEWKGVVEHSREFLLIIKSTHQMFEQIRSELIQEHSYEVPEVIALPVLEGSQEYLAWIDQQVGPGRK